MYQGNYTNQRRPRRRKLNRSFVLLVSCLALLVSVTGTLAYLVTNTPDVVNTFTPGKVSCTVEEPGWQNGNTVKQNVTIKNTGNTDAFIRAAVVATWVDEAGNISATPVESSDYTLQIDNSSWTELNGYYYCNISVAPNASTPVLITEASPFAGKAPSGYTLCIDILADAIQSKPDSVVQECWGVTISEGSVTAYTG